MSQATYAFVYYGSNDWKISSPEDWNLEVIDLEGSEEVLGHRRIDGSVCKVFRASDGRLVALTKTK